MPIPAIGAVSGTLPTAYLENTAASAPATDGSGFATSLAGAVDNVQQLSSTSKELAVQAVTGDLNDIHAASIASTRASVTLELVAAVRNKSVDAFNEIMRMQA
ncbi:flagellar hook-basal body complex protein FliE [Arthrobacter sp. Sa2BUA2]|uniref:Flagellar hook-basal body complex protein FliE n=1 Tax=Arthrobacter pullicola TaxID=2762224 RepID=A0ABR8YKJ6_9MICC|nr:flagellar hook-basal body complex protein FliE [Arthrobacter pullicola]MBD8044729.1 flagellar hook-basal body complex protein FliE [Arthrobacter pullicola]